MFNQLSAITEYPPLDPITDWLARFLVQNGIFAPIFLLFLEESGIPLPIPGDSYIAYTGYLIKASKLTYPVGFFLLVCAVLAGSTVLYALSRRYGQGLVLRFGKHLHISKDKLTLVERKFNQFGPLVIVFGRHIPGFRVPITIFSGISGVPYKTFIVSTFISIIFWIAFYLSLGERLGPRVLKFLNGPHPYWFLLILPILLLSAIFLLKHWGRK